MLDISMRPHWNETTIWRIISCVSFIGSIFLPLRNIPDHCGRYLIAVEHIWLPWNISDYCGTYMITMEHIWLLWNIYDHWGTYLITVEHIWSPWNISDHCGTYMITGEHIWPLCQFVHVCIILIVVILVAPHGLYRIIGWQWLIYANWTLD